MKTLRKKLLLSNFKEAAIPAKAFSFAWSFLFSDVFHINCENSRFTYIYLNFRVYMWKVFCEPFEQIY